MMNPRWAFDLFISTLLVFINNLDIILSLLYLRSDRIN